MTDLAKMVERHAAALQQSRVRLFDAIDALRTGRISPVDAEAEVRTAKAVNRKVRREIRHALRDRFKIEAPPDA